MQKIKEVSPIPGADAIECATVGGWKVVIKKGEFRPGDLAIYCEIDSWIPHALAPFLSKTEPKIYNNVAGERLRTVRLRGQLSQGLLLSGTICETGLMVRQHNSVMQHIFQEGDDLTEWLGIQKWEAPVPVELAGQVEGVFPSFIPRTDEERCQNLVDDIFVKHHDTRYEVTLKLDGCSFTGFYYNGKPGVCSRNWEIKINDVNANNTLVKTFISSGLMQSLGTIGKNIAIQAELMGPGIQKNREKLSAHCIYIFNIYDIDNAAYLSPADRRQVVSLIYQHGTDPNIVKQAPVVADNVSLSDLGIDNVDSLLTYAEGKSINHPVREGLVYKSVIGDFSFKAVSNSYLLKEDSRD